MSSLMEDLELSGLFSLDLLVELNISCYSFYEVGLKKYLAFSSENELIFIYIDSQNEKHEIKYEWDFLDNPVHTMCFEPTGTWLLILSDQKVLLVPFLPLFCPETSFDQKWSLTSVTVLPIAPISNPNSAVWWLTNESENILIFGCKTGSIIFYLLESQSIVGDCKVSDEITDLQICFDDSLDILALLITGVKLQQWKLVLEHRSFGYNWLRQIRIQIDKDKKDGFISFIKQLSKDKITMFTQGGSRDDKAQTVEYLLEPTEYLPHFRKGSNNWSLTAQYVNGRHFLTAFDLKDGTLILESPEEHSPSRTLRPKIKRDGLYVQGLWSQRLIFLLRKNEIELHSASFSSLQGEWFGVRRVYSDIWCAPLEGDVRRAHLMSTKEPPPSVTAWKAPKFLCDLQLPRFSLESCLIVTSRGAYILSTPWDTCEWLVGALMRGGSPVEQAAAAFSVSLPDLLRGAMDMLMAGGKVAPAVYLNSLAKSTPDSWAARLGVFGRLQELMLYKPNKNTPLGNEAITIQLLALLRKVAMSGNERLKLDVKLDELTSPELSELTTVVAAVGLWDIIQIFSIYRGKSIFISDGILNKKYVCRGALNCMVNYPCLIRSLLEKNYSWPFDFFISNRFKLDTIILKKICIWINPFQSQLKALMRDMVNGVVSVCVARFKQMTIAFLYLLCVIESREPRPKIHVEIPRALQTRKNVFVKRRTISCGYNHWGLVNDGIAKIFMAKVPITIDCIGMAIDLACGRHHTLLLAESGLYAAGDNTYGQLGLGCVWPTSGSVDAKGEFHYLPYKWSAQIVAVAAGNYHSAAIDAEGRLFTWGWNVHGQLGLGGIEDESQPKMVAHLQGRKVLSVGCGTCHTVMLTENGEVWACGSSTFGQLGHGKQDKSSIPIRVMFQDPIDMVAVGYFHNLALTNKGQLYMWGANPQQIRATNVRKQREANPLLPPNPLPPRTPLSPPTSLSPRTPLSPPTPLPPRTHLSPTTPLPPRTHLSPTTPLPPCTPLSHPTPLPTRTYFSPRTPLSPAGCSPYPIVFNPSMPSAPHLIPELQDTQNVRGRIVQLAAGWHQSFILDNNGTAYAWGLNFDGQLGTGERKHAVIPTEVKITKNNLPETSSPDTPVQTEEDDRQFKTQALIGCGGDFSVYVGDDDNVYSCGNCYAQPYTDKDKDNSRVYQMKTTKRIIKIPGGGINYKLSFHVLDKIQVLLPPNFENAKKKDIEPIYNPLTCLDDFDKSSWADEVIILLEPWMYESNFEGNLNMTAKLRYHRKNYADCLQMLLDNVNVPPAQDPLYVVHSIPENVSRNNQLSIFEEFKVVLTNLISKRIIDVSLTILNAEPFPEADSTFYKELPCSCNELVYFKRLFIPHVPRAESKRRLSAKASQVFDKCLNMFPVDMELWEKCVRLSKDYFIANELLINNFEKVLEKYTEKNSIIMAGAIMYSNDCAEYSKILTPNFFLKMCSTVLDTWE